MIPLGLLGGATPRAGGGGLGSLEDEILADSPWGYWQLGETAGPSTFLDLSGNGRHLTDFTGVTAGATGLVSGGTSTDFGSSARIQSTNNEFGAATASAFGGDKPFTILAVVNVGSLSANRTILHLGNVGVANSQGLFAEIRTDGVVRVQHITGIGYKFVDSDASAIPASTTKMVHARRTDGGTADGTLFVDGANVTSSAGGSSRLTGNIAIDATSSSGGSRISIGALQLSTPVGFMEGRMQHVAVFAAALSDARIAAHATASGL